MYHQVQHWHGCYGGNQLLSDWIWGLFHRREFWYSKPGDNSSWKRQDRQHTETQNLSKCREWMTVEWRLSSKWTLIIKPHKVQRTSWRGRQTKWKNQRMREGCCQVLTSGQSNSSYSYCITQDLNKIKPAILPAWMEGGFIRLHLAEEPDNWWLVWEGKLIFLLDMLLMCM